MNKNKIPIPLYKQPTISFRDGKNIIFFEYFNVKKYKHEVFEIDQSFSTGDTSEVEKQRRKVYRAIKRGYAPDIDLVEGEFKTHTVKIEEIIRIADISWFDLVLCEFRNWAPSSSRSSVGMFAGLVIGFEVLQLFSIIALLTQKVHIAEIGADACVILFFGIALFCEIIMRKRIEENYYNHYYYLPSCFKDYIGRIIIPIAIEAVIGGIYFYFKV